MQIHEIPRNYKGEGRILYIFSTKALIWMAALGAVGLIFYFIFSLIGLQIIGIIIAIIFVDIGFCIATFKVPDTKRFKITEATGGESIDDVIRRWFNFKRKKNRIYLYLKEETKDE